MDDFHNSSDYTLYIIIYIFLIYYVKTIVTISKTVEIVLVMNVYQLDSIF